MYYMLAKNSHIYFVRKSVDMEKTDTLDVKERMKEKYLTCMCKHVRR